MSYTLEAPTKIWLCNKMTLYETSCTTRYNFPKLRPTHSEDFLLNCSAYRQRMFHGKLWANWQRTPKVGLGDKPPSHDALVLCSPIAPPAKRDRPPADNRKQCLGQDLLKLESTRDQPESIRKIVYTTSTPPTKSTKMSVNWQWSFSFEWQDKDASKACRNKEPMPTSRLHC